MTFSTIGVLPEGRWFVREGGGHIWFVCEDPTVQPMVLLRGQLVPVVDFAGSQDAPLIMPKEHA